MTAQFPDGVTYRGKSYSLAGKNGSGLFDPTAHGMNPVGRCTACWREFVCSYAVDGSGLLLEKLKVCLDGPAPVLLGRPPTPDTDEYALFDAVYQGLNHRVAYTGGLLLAADFIEELYVHMGFHPAWKYREVHELIFRDGALVQEADVSSQVAAVRREVVDLPPESRTLATRAEISRQVAQCFSQDYSDWPRTRHGV